MFKRTLPHICIDMAVVFIVLWIIDRFNGAMHMLSRDVFKYPFLIFLIFVIVESVIFAKTERDKLPDKKDDINQKSN